MYSSNLKIRIFRLDEYRLNSVKELMGAKITILKYRKKNKYMWIPGSIWGVSVAIGLMAISVSMTFSISPFFMTNVLGLSLLSLGAIEGLAEGLAQISKLFSGVSGDYFKRKKPTLMVGFLLSIVSKPFFILANGAGLVIVSKVLERISNGVMSTPRDAYIAEVAPEDNRGTCFGLMMSFKTGGCVAGSLLIAGLLFLTENYRLLLWLGFGASVLSVIVLSIFMKEKIQYEPKTHKPKHHKLKLSEFKKLNFNYWSLLLVAMVYMCARFSDGFLILRMKELGGSAALCASIIGIFNAVSLLCCIPIGRLSDKFDRSKVLYFSIVTLVLSNLCFITAEGVAVAMVGVIFWGAQRGTSQILFTAMISDEAPKEIMGTAIGIFFITTGLMSLVAGAVAGYVADVSLSFAFVFGAGMALASMLLLFVRAKIIHLYTGKLTQKDHRKVTVAAEPLTSQSETGTYG